MVEANRCPQCGAVLHAAAPQGLCPECLMKQALASGPAADFVPPSPAELNVHYPQLEIVELLGRGGMGAVYKARQPTLDRWVALKILPLDAGRDPAFAERFMREARALARLSHPHIVTVHDFGKTNGLYYFLMEFVDGVHLRRLIQEGRLTPEAALKIVPQICDALEYAHNQGVVHRDIKPENLLLDQRGQVKIADFGLAKLLGSDSSVAHLTGTGEMIGTHHYMAPEQIQNPHAVDHRADIYSLGVVFYEMLTGELPLGRFPTPSQKVQVDVRLDEVVLRALAMKPEHRYQRASEIKTEVDTIVRLPNTGRPLPRSCSSTISPGQATGQVAGPWSWVMGQPLRVIPKAFLLIVFTACLLQFFSYGESRSQRGRGLADIRHFQIGFPSPWFEVEKDTSGLAFHIYWISWAWAVAGLGALACQLLWKGIKPTSPRLARLEKLGPPGCLLWVLIIFLGFAITVMMAELKSG